MDDYSKSPFRFFDHLPTGEGERCYKRGYDTERRIIKWVGGMGGTVKHLASDGVYNNGYDVSIITAAGRPLKWEIKMNAGIDRTGASYETFFCETEHAGGDRPGWMKSGTGCSHFVILNESTGELHFFDRNELKAYVMGSAGRRARHNGCEGRLVGWTDVEAGYRFTFKLGEEN